MKTVIPLLLFLFTTITSFAQLQIATTEDGRRVLLKEDNTWEYIDGSNNKTDQGEKNLANCDLPDNFKEPEGNEKIQRFLKRMDATTEDLKKHVAVDNNCSIEEVKILSISEQKGNGIYLLCVVGQSMKYKRTGSVFSRQGENPIGKK